MKHILSIIFCSFVVSACSSVKVDTEHKPEVDFSKYRSYAWHSSPSVEKGKNIGRKLINPDLEKRIRKTIDRELSAKGFHTASLEEAQLLVSTDQRVYAEEEKANRANPNWSRTPYIANRTGGGRMAKTRRGLLILEVADAKTKQVVWTGTAKSLVNEDVSSYMEIDRFVVNLLKGFPPEKK